MKNKEWSLEWLRQIAEEENLTIGYVNLEG